MKQEDYKLIIRITLGDATLYYQGTKYLVVNDPAFAARFLDAADTDYHVKRAIKSTGGTATVCERDTEMENYKKTLV